MAPDPQFEGILLASDLDGTLLSPDGTLDPENDAALREFLSLGGRFAIATGRSRVSVQRNCPDIPADLPGIFCNGAHLYDLAERRTILSHPLPASARALILEILERFRTIGLEVFTEEGAFLVRSCSVLKPQIAAEGIRDIENEFDRIPVPWLKILLAGTPQELAEVRETLRGMDLKDWTLAASDTHLLDLMAKGVSKGSALLELKAMLERSGRPFRTVACGDNENDLDMLSIADLSIVPGNGTHGVREKADHIVPHHAEPMIPVVLRILREEFRKNTAKI